MMIGLSLVLFLSSCSLSVFLLRDRYSYYHHINNFREQERERTRGENKERDPPTKEDEGRKIQLFRHHEAVNYY